MKKLGKAEKVIIIAAYIFVCYSCGVLLAMIISKGTLLSLLLAIGIIAFVYVLGNHTQSKMEMRR